MSPSERASNPAITPHASVQALRGSFPGDLGIELLEIEPARARGRMHIDQRHLHPGGFVHGGCWVAFADTVAAWARCATWPPTPPSPRLS